MKKIFLPSIFSTLLSAFCFAQNVGINNNNPIHAKLEVNGSIGDAAAIFGADKYGTTIKADFPGIGFNFFYNGGSKTIKAGYAALMEMNPSTGNIYIGGFNSNQSVTDFGDITGYRQILTMKQNGYVGINTVSPLSSLHVADSSVLFSAAGDIPVTPNIPPLSGGGRRMMWYPDKAAFRAGYIFSNQWDGSNVGNYSVAMGRSTTASGIGSIALGSQTTASGDYSTAMGIQTIAGGAYSVAMGIGCNASG